MPRLFSAETGPDFSRNLMALPLLIAALCVVPVLYAANNAELFLWINQPRGPWMDGVWGHATMLGDTLLGLVLLFAIGYRNPNIVWSGLASALLATLLVHGAKDLLLVARPAAVLPAEALHIIGPTLKKYSFPSGHTATAFTLAAIVCLHSQRIPVRLIAFLLAALVGLSRMGVGAHWPMDVLGGAIAGWIAGMAGTRLAYHWEFGTTRAAQIVSAIVLVGCVGAILFRPDPIIESTRVFQILFALGVGGWGMWGTWNKLRATTQNPD